MDTDRKSKEKRAKGLEQTYVYVWANNSKRKTLQWRTCRVIERLPMNSALVEFTDNKQREVVSRNALRVNQQTR